VTNVAKRSGRRDDAPAQAPRRGLVLGGGGQLGAAWMVGALWAIEEVHGIDLREVDYLVGTSAGSIIAALLASGVTPDELRRHQLGESVSDGPLAGYWWDYDNATGGGRPGVPHFGPGSAGMLRNIGRIRQMPPTAVLSAFLPEGRGSLARVGHLVEAVNPPGEWTPHPGTWIVAMDYESGERVAFGSPGAPPADLASAVMASCSIPAWFAPTVINDRRYVDGGACSATSVDLLADLGLDEVFVVAPMVSFAVDRPNTLVTRLERRWRVQITKRCLTEAAKVHRSGAQVTILGPGPEDLEAMGANLMDVRRRPLVMETSLRTSVAALTEPGAATDLQAAVEASSRLPVT
jgi:NTE family protein